MSLSKTMCALVCAGVLAVGSTALGGVEAADSYELTWLGLAGSQFVDATGKVYAEGYEIADNGLVLGRNRIYYGGTTNLGDAWWVSDGETTTRVGLLDAAHTKSTGYQMTYVLGFYGGGQFVGGESQKYRADDSTISNTPWIFDGTQTIALGLTGAAYTHADGYTQPSRWEGGDNGNFAGMNVIYNGGTTNMGTAGWVYDYSTDTHTRVGLTGAQYVRDDGYERVAIGRVSPDGNYIFGRSYLYSGMSALGTHGFRYDVSTDTTVQIGLITPDYVRADGYMEVEIRRANTSGQLNGLSRRYSGATDMGRVAWLFDGTGTVAISPAGAEFVRSDGYSDSDTWYINSSGQVAGEATTYVGASTGGKRAWFYNGSTTQVLDGLQGGYFVNANGQYQALPNALNDAGQVTGTSYRYNGGTGIGLQGWFYDSTTDTTVALGLTDPAYTRESDNKQYHFPSALSETGMVLGASDRYDGLFSKGYWVYDWQTDATYELAFSTRSDGYYNTARRSFTNDGDGVVGYYELFDEFDVSLGYSLYYWTIDRGTSLPVWVDLSDLTTLGGAESLYNAYTASCDMNTSAWFTGTGTMADGSRGAYMLTPDGSGPVGDFDGDSDVDADDIDLLCANMTGDGVLLPGGSEQYDLDGDGDADSDDMDILIHDLVETSVGVGTEYGDFNLDGTIDTVDLTILGTYFGIGTSWNQGNANCDTTVDTVDLTILGTYFGFVSAGAIPEPATLALLSLGAVGLFRKRSRA